VPNTPIEDSPLWTLFKALQTEVFELKQDLKTAKSTLGQPAGNEPAMTNLLSEVQGLREDLAAAEKDMETFKDTIKKLVSTNVDERLTDKDALAKMRTIMFPPGDPPLPQTPMKRGRQHPRSKEGQVSTLGGGTGTQLTETPPAEPRALQLPPAGSQGSCSTAAFQRTAGSERRGWPDRVLVTSKGEDSRSAFQDACCGHQEGRSLPQEANAEMRRRRLGRFRQTKTVKTEWFGYRSS
jgi:hypothetical protein